MLASSVVDKWLELLTPSAAALAILFAIALVIQSIRHGRSLRRLETRLAEREGAGARVSLDRLRELQRRRQGAAVSVASATDGATAEGSEATEVVPEHAGDEYDEDYGREPVGRFRWQPIAAAVAVLAVVSGTTWYLFFRGDDAGTASEPTTTLTQTTTGSRTGTTRTGGQLQTPDEIVTTVSATPKPLANGKGAYTVKVLNGSGIPGLAGTITPIVAGHGYSTVSAGNVATQDIKKSFVVYVDRSKIDVADNVAKDLGVTELAPLDGVQLENEADAVGVDVLVVLGNDPLAQRYRP